MTLPITLMAGCVYWGYGTKEGSLLYSPKLPEELIPRLWRLAQERKVPMTHLVRVAVAQYLTKEEKGENDSGEVNEARGNREDRHRAG